MLLLLDKTAGPAVCVDRRKPLSTERLDAVLCEAWPRLKGQVTYQEADAKDVTVEPGALVVSAHGCGRLTDTVLNMAIAARSPVAVLPCCQSLRLCDTGGLEAWMEGRLAIDAIRAIRLRTAGYTIRAQTIPAEITPQNRLLIGLPNSPAPST